MTGIHIVANTPEGRNLLREHPRMVVNHMRAMELEGVPLPYMLEIDGRRHFSVIAAPAPVNRAAAKQEAAKAAIATTSTPGRWKR